MFDSTKRSLRELLAGEEDLPQLDDDDETTAALEEIDA